MNRALITPAQFAAFGAAGTDAHRMFSDGDGWIERLAEDVLISHKSDAALDAMREGLAEWTAANGWQPRRIFGKLLPKQNEDRDPPLLLSGDAALPLAPRVDGEIANHLGYINGALAGRQWLMGDTFSGADVQLSFIGEFAGMQGVRAPYAHLEAWIKRCQARPAYLKAVDRGGPYRFAV